MNTFDVDTYIMNVETPSISIRESTIVMPPEVYNFESNTEENRNLNIHEKASNMDSNVNISVPSTISTSTILPPPPTSPLKSFFFKPHPFYSIHQLFMESFVNLLLLYSHLNPLILQMIK